MQELFVSPQSALDLVKIGFNEPCLALYNREGVLRLSPINNPSDRNKTFRIPQNASKHPAPLYQQAITWMMKKISNEGRELAVFIYDDHSGEIRDPFFESAITSFDSLEHLLEKLISIYQNDM